MTGHAYKLAIIAGEVSGDLLGAELKHLRRHRAGRGRRPDDPELVEPSRQRTLATPVERPDARPAVPALRDRAARICARRAPGNIGVFPRYLEDY